MDATTATEKNQALSGLRQVGQVEHRLEGELFIDELACHTVHNLRQLLKMQGEDDACGGA